MKLQRLIPVLLIALLFGAGRLHAQVTSVKTVTAVSYRLDSLNTPEETAAVQQIFKRQRGIDNFDLKGKKLEFTIDQAFASDIPAIKQALAQAGLPVTAEWLDPNQQLTTVRQEDHNAANKPAEVTEEEMRRTRFPQQTAPR